MATGLLAESREGARGIVDVVVLEIDRVTPLAGRAIAGLSHFPIPRDWSTRLAMDHPEELPADIRDSLSRLGLVPAIARVEAERLTGGVSSDIWKVAGFGRVFCVKRAMAKLAVKDDWFAPVERNRYERRWYEIAGARVAGLAPEVIAVDDDAMFFVMEYLDPADHRLWKSRAHGRSRRPRLRRGGRARASPRSMRRPRGTRRSPRCFRPVPLFEALRLEPYLRATGRRHPALAGRLDALADRTAATRRALVHGDVSPKNIMIGPSGPVLLDAECAWYGDPAFDLAFCLNHLLLKCLACACRRQANSSSPSTARRRLSRAA